MKYQILFAKKKLILLLFCFHIWKSVLPVGYSENVGFFSVTIKATGEDGLFSRGGQGACPPPSSPPYPPAKF